MTVNNNERATKIIRGNYHCDYCAKSTLDKEIRFQNSHDTEQCQIKKRAERNASSNNMRLSKRSRSRSTSPQKPSSSNITTTRHTSHSHHETESHRQSNDRQIKLWQQEKDSLTAQLNEKCKTIIGYRELVIKPSDTLEEIEARELDMRRTIDCKLNASDDDEESVSANRNRRQYNANNSDASVHEDGEETETSTSKRA
jgi:hypothetical protein